MTEYRVSRRRFLAHAAVAAAALPLLGRIGNAEAAPLPKLPKLPASKPQAKALGYVEDAGKTTSRAHKAGSVCANCQFFTAATGACVLFAGYSVAPKGWCTAWAKKAG